MKFLPSRRAWRMWRSSGLFWSYVAEWFIEQPRNWITCRMRGHMWDSDRPSGPLGFARGDTCWRCDAIRPYREEAQ